MVQNKDKVITIFTVAIILLLPVFFILLYLFYALKFLLIVLFVSALSWLILFSTKHQMGFMTLFKLGLYSSTIMVLLEVISIPIQGVEFVRAFFIPLILFILFFIIGALLVGGTIHDDD